MEERLFNAALKSLGTGFSPGRFPQDAGDQKSPALRPGMIV